MLPCLKLNAGSKQLIYISQVLLLALTISLLSPIHLYMDMKRHIQRPPRGDGSLVWALLDLGTTKGPRFKPSGVQGNLVHALYR